MNKLKKESIREQIRDIILENIYSGNFKSGTRLREKELAEQFGVSQAPVREALRELEGLNCVVTVPYKGTVVKEVTVEDLAIAYGIRGELEKMALEMVDAEKDIDIDHLLEIHAKLAEAINDEDTTVFAQLNVDFHRSIVELSDNEMLLKMWNQVSFPMFVKNSLDYTDANIKDLYVQHEPVIQALKEKDYLKAAELMKEHAEFIRRELMKSNIKKAH